MHSAMLFAVSTSVCLKEREVFNAKEKIWLQFTFQRPGYLRRVENVDIIGVHVWFYNDFEHKEKNIAYRVLQEAGPEMNHSKSKPNMIWNQNVSSDSSYPEAIIQSGINKLETLQILRSRDQLRNLKQGSFISNNYV